MPTAVLHATLAFTCGHIPGYWIDRHLGPVHTCHLHPWGIPSPGYIAHYGSCCRSLRM